MATTQIKMTASAQPITERAMLVRLNVSRWTARKHDKSISAEVAHSHNASTDAGRYNKVLIARAALEVINSAESRARAFHYANTLPWRDDGYRILPAANYFQYTTALRGLRADFDGAVQSFIDSYPSFVEEARIRLNGMFNDDDYPAAEDVKLKFGFEFGVLPLPSGNDFRVDIDATELEKVRSETDLAVAALVDEAMGDLWKRIHDAVSRMATSLRDYEVDPETGRKSNIFRDTVVENIRDLVKMLPRLNVTDNAALTEMIDLIEQKLCDADAVDIRAHEALRLETAQSAEDILAQMAGYIG